jgi:hypothetical protein
VAVLTVITIGHAPKVGTAVPPGLQVTADSCGAATFEVPEMLVIVGVLKVEKVIPSVLKPGQPFSGVALIWT